MDSPDNLIIVDLLEYLLFISDDPCEMSKNTFYQFYLTFIVVLVNHRIERFTCIQSQDSIRWCQILILNSFHTVPLLQTEFLTNSPLLCCYMHGFFSDILLHLLSNTILPMERQIQQLVFLSHKNILFNVMNTTFCQVFRNISHKDCSNPLSQSDIKTNLECF